MIFIFANWYFVLGGRDTVGTIAGIQVFSNLRGLVKGHRRNALAPIAVVEENNQQRHRCVIQ